MNTSKDEKTVTLKRNYDEKKDQEERIEQEKVEAESRGDKELAEQLHLQSLEAGEKLAQFIMKHRKKKKKHFPL